MARIRSIKPEFCTSEQVVNCSRDARLLFVQMWMFCDDNGVHPDSVKRLKMECYPADDDLDSTSIRRMVDELVSNGLLERFEVDGEAFLHVTGWSRHQKVDRPSYKHPKPPEKNNKPVAAPSNSTNDRRTLVEPSPPESSRVERKGEESSRVDASVRAPDPEPQSPPPSVNISPIVEKALKGIHERASRAKGQPNFADPEVRKQRWFDNVSKHVYATFPPEEAIALVTGVVEGDPAAIRTFEAASRDLARLKHAEPRGTA